MEPKIDLAPINNQGLLVEPLGRISSLFDIDPLQPLTAVRDAMMARWVSPGKERWEEPEVVLDSRVRLAKFWECVYALPLYNEIWPGGNKFSQVLILGGRLRPTDRKNAFVARLWEQGCAFDCLALLGGDRPLNIEAEGLHVLSVEQPGGLPLNPSWVQRNIDMGRYATESDMLKELWLRSELPPGLRSIPIHYIRAQASNAGRRAHTSDTYRAWLEQVAPEPGSILVISTSPHAPFQYWDAVRTLVPHGFEVLIAAPSAALGPQDVKYFTGAVARWLRSFCCAQGLT